ncbi:hypothetical protein, conserved [Leishmania tarentolae]|uniref:Leucine-rich repeat protein n=1 Tax=Leishmania tarentolae TaxID=5689 RepID=A0A640KH75_LEITA|nr:hypothetical protein, conserved [Leishmania tarentolae]
MPSTLVAVYEKACSDAVMLPNSGLARCLASLNEAMPLQVLSLSTNLIGPRGLVVLFPVLRECRHTLHTLDLSYNCLDNVTIRKLVLCFSNGGFSALRRLELRGNLLTYQGGKCLVHWCEGLQAGRQAHSAQEADGGVLDGISADVVASAAPSGASTSPHCGTELWCDAADVHIDYIGIEGTAMPDGLKRSLQQRIASAIARREARRLGHSSQRPQLNSISIHESGPVAEASVVASSPRQPSPDPECVTAPVLDGPAMASTAHVFAGSPADFFMDESDEEQHPDGTNANAAVDAAAVVLTEVCETSTPGFLQDDADIDVLHNVAYESIGADGNAFDGTNEVADVKGNSNHDSSNAAADVAGTRLSPDEFTDDRSLEVKQRAGSVAETLPFPSSTVKGGSGSGTECEVSSSRSASSPPLSRVSSQGFDYYSADPLEAQRQPDAVEQYPPPIKTASNISDELGCEVVTETAGNGGGGSMGYDDDAVPTWLEEL